MVILCGWLFLMIEVPLYRGVLKGFEFREITPADVYAAKEVPVSLNRFLEHV